MLLTAPFIYFYIVEKLGAVAASSVTYIPPVVALLIGALLVGGPIGFVDCFATFLIFIGVFLLKRKKVSRNDYDQPFKCHMS